LLQKQPLRALHYLFQKGISSIYIVGYDCSGLFKYPCIYQLKKYISEKTLWELNAQLRNDGIITAAKMGSYCFVIPNITEKGCE